MRIQKFVVDFFELPVLFFEFMELFIDESALSGSLFISVLLGLKVNKVISLNHLSHKVHEHIFLVLSHVKNGIEELLLAMRV
jgi:hypothetical protein